MMPLIIVDMKVTKLLSRSEYYYETIIKRSKKLEVKLELLKLYDPCKLWDYLPYLPYMYGLWITSRLKVHLMG